MPLLLPALDRRGAVRPSRRRRGGAHARGSQGRERGVRAWEDGSGGGVRGWNGWISLSFSSPLQLFPASSPFPGAGSRQLPVVALVCFLRLRCRCPLLCLFFSPLPPATFLSLSSPTRRCGRPVGGWGLRIGSDLSDECLVWFYSKSKSSPSSATADKCCKSTEQNVLKSQIPNGSVRVEIREY